MIYTTTLRAIYDHDPCRTGWQKLLTHLHKFRADAAPLPLSAILESNGLDDALWCLRAVPEARGDARLFAVWCARRVEYLMTPTPRIASAMDAAERAVAEDLDASWLSLTYRAYYDMAYLASRSGVDEMRHGKARHDRMAQIEATARADWAAHATLLAVAADAAISASNSAVIALANDAVVRKAAKYAVVSFSTGRSNYARTYNAARKAAVDEQTEKFREMFCTNDPTPV